ncbi:DUF2189 domain-containing protein [Xanthobacter dioxanivorans]|uniref:DUF2189 domain-containing protein n=1 Tax=Xanthobacter dioxanivorans TaxID=2528964 RepID=A0A974SIB6_9HYPH|nr:DUF2189 domain-containing protein [Xanthobacter dioxanivorans]QRG06277.1 DUF2189 domain-containing protein [Xanthobacter dioxanivorans]
MADILERPAGAVHVAPTIRAITFADVKAALLEGVEDFNRAPVIGALFGAVYAFGGIILLACVFALDLGYLAYPLFAGSVLIGPFVAAGLYDVSRELEAGRTPTLRGVLSTVFAQRKRELGWMAFVTIFAFIIWMYQVRLLLALFLGFASFGTMQEFMRVLFTTSDGLSFLAVGHVVGAALALGLFSITVVSFPLLMDRDLDVVTAMITSVQAVLLSPGPMIAWGMTVVAVLFIGAAPCFLGLIVVLPVLGFATWHLYRRVISPAA